MCSHYTILINDYERMVSYGTCRLCGESVEYPIIEDEEEYPIRPTLNYEYTFPPTPRIEPRDSDIYTITRTEPLYKPGVESRKHITRRLTVTRNNVNIFSNCGMPGDMPSAPHHRFHKGGE